LTGSHPAPRAGRAAQAAALGLLAAALALVFTLPLAAACVAPKAALAATPGLRSGDSGRDVAWAQLRLAELGVFRGVATGYFGPVTEAAVKRYQQQAGLAVSGVLGPQTARCLLRTPWRIKVNKGDTLEVIARRYSLSINEVLTANPQIVDPDLIYVGQAITVPGTAGILKIAGIGSAPTAVPATGGSLSPASAPPASGQAKPLGGTATGGVGSTQAGTTPPTIAPGAKVVLTFNDGPDPDVLPRILEILRRSGCRAVFFFCGEQIEAYPELVRAASAQGHSIQCHGWRHEALSALPETRISAELYATSQLILSLTGVRPVFFRPPEGAFDEAVLMSARRTGHRVVLWQNIGAMPDGPATIGRLDKYLGGETVIMLPGSNPATPGYLEALLDRWLAAGVRLLKPTDLESMPVVL